MTDRASINPTWRTTKRFILSSYDWSTAAATCLLCASWVQSHNKTHGKEKQSKASSISHGQTKDDVEGERECWGTVHGRNIPTALTQRERERERTTRKSIEATTSPIASSFQASCSIQFTFRRRLRFYLLLFHLSLVHRPSHNAQWSTFTFSIRFYILFDSFCCSELSTVSTCVLVLLACPSL